MVLFDYDESERKYLSSDLGFCVSKEELSSYPEFRIPLGITYMNFKLKLTTLTSLDRT